MIIQAGALCKWTNDSQRFLLEHTGTIHDSPSHIYHSALPFSPSSSWLCKCYGIELSQEVQVARGLPAEWGACLCTLPVDRGASCLSYQNNGIAAGTYRGDIIILDAITGRHTAILSGHTSIVYSVTYSPDGISLVSGSSDNTVKLWDVQTGGIVKTFHGHTQCVQCVSVSADFVRIASGSYDHTIRLWNIQTGECSCVIDQKGRVEHVSFFPTDPQHLLSVCKDKVKQWDIDGHQVGHAYDGSYVTFSSDGTKFASYCGRVVKVQNTSSRVIVAELQTGSYYHAIFCFSPDNRLIAVAFDATVYIWDITSSTPNLIKTFVGRPPLAFSSPSSLISTYDGSIKFWQIGPSSKDLLGAPKSTFLTSSKIRSITLQAKDGIIITSDSDGAVRTWDILTGLCKASFQTPEKSSYGYDARLINGKLIFCWNTPEKVNIWDAEKGELLLEILVDIDSFPTALKMSEDGSRVFGLRDWCIEAWSTQTRESLGRVSMGFQAYNIGYFTVGNSKVWVCSRSYSQEVGWDFGIPGSSGPVQLPKTHSYRLHPNGIMLWEIDLHRIMDTSTGKVVFQLPKSYGRPLKVQWNGQYLVACFSPTEVLILDCGCILK